MIGELIPIPTALAMLQRAGVSPPWPKLSAALQFGEVASQGIPASDNRSTAEGFGEPLSIKPDRWAKWQFHRERQSLDPPSNRRIAAGFCDVRVSRADVERLALASASTAALTASAIKCRNTDGDKGETKRKARKPTIPATIASTLQNLYPNGRPSTRKIEELIAEAEARIGRKISSSTMKRALQSAWRE